MTATQVSVFLENKSGRLSLVTKCLADAGINLRALYVADTQDFGILRFIVDDPEKACEILKNAGMTANLTEVVAAVMPDDPGALNKIAELFDENQINLEYFYAYIGRVEGKAIAIFRVNDCEKAVNVLKNAGVEVLDKEDLIRI